MLKSILSSLLIFLSVLATSCSLGPIENIDTGPRYEAIAWLESNPNPYALAGNRFESTEDAITFIKTLYELGAKEVLVTNIYDEDWRIQAEGGPYADTLIIILPEDQGARKKLFEITNEEAALEGFTREKDYGQQELLLWWD